MPREISAGAVLFRRGPEGIAFLLLLYPGGHWDFPKGNIEKGETAQQTVRREVGEETGIKRLKIHPDFKETIRYSYRWRNESIFKLVVYYLVETRQKKIVLSYEHDGAEWLDRRAALRRLTYANSRLVLEMALKRLGAGPRPRRSSKREKLC